LYLSSAERLGGKPITNSHKMGIKKAALNCHLQGMKCLDSFETWSNKHDNRIIIFSKIDKHSSMQSI